MQINSDTYSKDTEKNTGTKNQVIAMRRKDFCTRWSICLRTLDDLVTAGIVPTIKLGKRCVRIPVEPADAALMAYMANGKEGAA